MEGTWLLYKEEQERERVCIFLHKIVCPDDDLHVLGKIEFCLPLAGESEEDGDQDFLVCKQRNKNDGSNAEESG